MTDFPLCGLCSSGGVNIEAVEARASPTFALDLNAIVVRRICFYAVWKLKTFSTTQILREINFGPLVFQKYHFKITQVNISNSHSEWN